MTDFVPFLLVLAIGAAAAVLTTGTLVRRISGIALASTVVLTPWLLPPSHTLVRGLLAIFLAVGLFRVIDLRSGTWSLGERVRHVLSVVDTRKIQRAPPRIEVGALGLAGAWALLALLSYGLLTRVAPGVNGPWHRVLRWTGALAFVYTLSEGAYLVIFAAHRAVGLVTPLLHNHPAAALTVQEFWGKRWNRTVSAWLGETLFWPMARRRRPVVGVCLAFGVSGVMHAYVAYVAVGTVMALSMLGFFALQGALVLVEGATRATRWGRVRSRLWTVAWMAGASPMFTEPMLRAMGV
jgi:hypothetical protein